MNRYVIIVAGGAGTRIGTKTPKQFLLLAGKPILMHTIEAFSGLSVEVNVIIVLPGQSIRHWSDLCEKFPSLVSHSVIAGGKFRGESVRNGLGCITEQDALVAIHDGVRPFVDKKIIENGFRLAADHGTAVPVCEINDSVRLVDNELNHPIERSKLRTVQTPQCFRLSLLREAYAGNRIESFTDDATLVESLGYDIQLFEGNKENIKITTPFDMLVAEAIIRRREMDNFK